MSTNSSQSSAFLLIGVIVAGVLYGLFNLSTDLEQNTLSGSFTKSTKDLYKNDVKEIAMTEFGKPAATRSDLSGVSMPSYKKSANSNPDAGYSQESGIDFPSTGVSTVDVQNLSRKTTRTAVNSNFTYQTNVLQSNSVVLGNGGSIISAQKAPSQSDIDAMFMFNAQTKEVGSTQGSIRATGALAAKTAAASTGVAGKKGAKKVLDDPGEPGAGSGGNLPVGDGVWVLLMFAGVYLTVKRF